MKRIASVLMILFSLALVIAVPALAQRGNDDTRSINVSGDAEVRVVPDQVILVLGVAADDMVLTEAKRKSDEKSASLLKALDKQGVAKKDIQSDYVKIEPRYDMVKHERVLLGYFVDKTYVVTVRDIEKFEPILSAALESGAESVQGIQFITTELKKHREIAREKALQAAHEKATKMAAALDMKIGRALSIAENSSRWFSPYNSRGRGGYSQIMVDMPPGGESDTGTLEPGKISVTASVSVRFELK